MDEHTVVASVFDGPQHQDLRPGRRQLEHLLPRDRVQLSRVGNDPRVRREHPFDVGVYLADEAINIDMIVQNIAAGARIDISFTLPKEDLRRAEPVLAATAREIGARGIETDSNIAKVSLVGAGMKSSPGVAADMFDALSHAGVDVQIISTSSIRISCVVPSQHVASAVRALHDKFRLAEDAVIREEHPDTVTDQLRAVRHAAGSRPDARP